MTNKQTAQDKIESPKGLSVLNINCWNEWTEGSSLAPDIINGMAYLEAVKEMSR